MKNESLSKIWPVLLCIVIIVAGLFGLILLGKIFWALICTPFSLPSIVIKTFNLFLSILSLFAIIAVPIIVIIYVSRFTADLFDKLTSRIDDVFIKLDEISDLTKKSLRSSAGKVFPILIAGVIQFVIILLSDNFATRDTKVILSLYMWATTTLLLLTFSKSGTSRIFGIVVSVVAALVFVIFLIYKYELYTVGGLNTTWKSIKTQASNLTLYDLTAWSFIIFMFLLIIVVALYYGLEKKNNSN